MASSLSNSSIPFGYDNQYFYEDEVFRINKKGLVQFGIILENSEASFSSDEESYVNKGQIKIAWYPSGKEDVLYQKFVGLADRTLMPGDVVRRIEPGKESQLGYCREINMKADLKIVGTKYIVKNVNAERLRPLVKMPRDNAVCLDSWVGSTKCVNEKVILRSSCGAVIEVSDIDLCSFKDKNTKFRSGLFADTIFYPGQIVTGRLESIDNIKLLTPSIVLKTNKKGKPLSRKFMVQSVQIEGIWVHWQCKALSEDGNVKDDILQQPNPYVTGEDLKRLKFLNLFESCMLQINDKNYLKISDCDVIIKKSQWEKEQAIKYKLIWGQQQKDEKQLNKNIKTGLKNNSDKIKIKLTEFDNKKLCVKLSKLAQQTNVVTANSLKIGTQSKQLKLSTEDENITIEESDDLDNRKINIVSDIERKETEKSDNIDENIEINKEINLNNIEINSDDSKLKPIIEVLNSTDDWQTDEDDFDFDSLNSESTTTTMSSCSSPTPKSSPKRSPLLHKKQMKKIRKNSRDKSPNNNDDKKPNIGDEIVTEALVVYSTMTVVWQDGTVETNIPSTQLYPIHHLDNHEFFPGDFVLSEVENTNTTFRDYGVIQTVDHLGRTAHVKWFVTYTSAEEPRPSYTGESEVSVYDLKDHPDFQYRPGTIVIRVANFIGEDATCTAGQIIDNYIDGRVKVWWVDGHISMCWPQDLFEVGQYDADNNFWGNNDDSDDSWETESETSEQNGETPIKLKSPHLSTNLERVRVAMSRLEEIFNINPNLQNQEVMRKLLAIYKKCRYLDRLMNTSFFHEDHFMGLLEPVRKVGDQTVAEQAQDQKNRLFNSPNSKQGNNNTANGTDTKITSTSIYPSKEYAPKVILNLSSTPFKYSYSYAKKRAGRTEINIITAQETNNLAAESNNITDKLESSNQDDKTNFNLSKCVVSASRHSGQQQSIVFYDSNTKLLSPTSVPLVYENSLNKLSSTPERPILLSESKICNEKNKLLSSVMSHIDKVTQETEKSTQLKLLSNTHGSQQSQDDSGNYSHNLGDGCSSTSYASSNDLTIDMPNNSLLKVNDDQKSISCSSIEFTEDSPELVCLKLCSLMKHQLVKALQVIQQKYCNNSLNLNDIVNMSHDEEEELVDEENLIVEEYINIDNFEKIHEKNFESSNNKIESSSEIEDKKIENENENNTDSNVRNESNSKVENHFIVPEECFQVLGSAPSSHKFHLTIFHPSNAQQYYKAIRKEHTLLRNSLPPGVWVRVFEDRMDLISVMIEGPKKTPYEDGIFFFDIQLGRDYPRTPPSCYYISYCSDRLNPNLYEDGKVCVSLLGTWSGRFDSEIWGPNSTLLQVIVSIQGLILVAEPYYNEAGYEKQKGTQQGRENSRMYNEMVIIKLVQAMTNLLNSPPEIFHDEISIHFQVCGKLMYDRIKSWMNYSSIFSPSSSEENKTIFDKTSVILPEFPLVPASRGWRLTLTNLLETFYEKVKAFSSIKINENK